MHSQSEDVRAGVLNALYWDLRVPRDHLSVDVENGWVTVSGRWTFPIKGLAPSSTLEASLALSASPT